MENWRLVGWDLVRRQTKYPQKRMHEYIELHQKKKCENNFSSDCWLDNRRFYSRDYPGKTITEAQIPWKICTGNME